MRNIEIISENDLCISCGACSHICPFNNIDLILDNRIGKWIAKSNDRSHCRKCNGAAFCLSVCPSYHLDYLALAYSNENHLLGRIRKVYNGYSKNDKTRFESSSGGFIREMCHTLLLSKKVNGIIALSHGDGLDYFPKSLTDVHSMPNSIYHNICYQNALNELKRSNGKFAIIGLPCQITSIELLLNKRKYSYLKDRVHLKIALICGYSFDRISAMAYAHYNRFNLEVITYRERGRYRKTRLKSSARELLIDSLNLPDFKSKLNHLLFTDPFLAQTGCLYCVDHLCYCADLVIGDAWQDKYSHDRIGTNIIICRTRKAEALVSSIDTFRFEEGYLPEIIESQSIRYATGSLGEGIKKLKFRNRSFVPDRIRTHTPDDIEVYRFRLSDLLKIKIIKPLLISRKYELARLLYLLIYVSNLKSFINRLINYIR